MPSARGRGVLRCGPGWRRGLSVGAYWSRVLGAGRGARLPRRLLRRRLPRLSHVPVRPADPGTRHRSEWSDRLHRGRHTRGPVFFFAMIFAIAMDYTVFLLSSAREHWEDEGDAR